MCKRKYAVLVGLAVLAMALCAVPASAAETAEVSLTVTIRSLGVSVSDGSAAFGTLDAGGTAVTGGGEIQTVANTGNADEDFGLKISDEDDLDEWTASAAADANVYVLSAQLTDALGAWDGNDILTTSVQFANGTILGGDGDGIAPAADIDLYFKLGAPSSVTGGGAADEHTITVEVSCQTAA